MTVCQTLLGTGKGHHGRGIPFFDDFKTWWLAEGAALELGKGQGYQGWLRAEVEATLDGASCTDGSKHIPMLKMSASTDALAGGRAVLPPGVCEKARPLSLTRAWPNAPDGKFLVFERGRLRSEPQSTSKGVARGQRQAWMKQRR